MVSTIPECLSQPLTAGDEPVVERTALLGTMDFKEMQ